jgi:hypothetical protein
LDVVRVPERDDVGERARVVNTEIVQASTPRIQLLAARDLELDVIEIGSKLTEGFAVVASVLQETDRPP